MIRIERDGGLWTITLDRPDKANALTEDMLETLCHLVEDAQEAQALVLTGTGRVFSAGADLEAARAGLATSPLWERLSGAIAAHPGLTIAALNGTAAGGSLGMVLACDLRVSVPGARLFYPVMKLGFLPQPSDPIRLCRLVGPARSKQMLLSARRITVEEALTWGLIDMIAADALAAASELCQEVLAAKPGHAAAIKAMIPG